MRVMLDTNILVSMIIFPNQIFLDMLETITKHHNLVLSSYVLDELFDVVTRKFPKRKEAFKKFLAAIPYEMFVTPQDMDLGLFEIRDAMDYPVLYSAIVSKSDVLITGDKDILMVERIDRPEILTARDFVVKYGEDAENGKA